MAYKLETDPFNRLIVSGGRASEARKFRRVLDGSFIVGPGNSLAYEVKSPLDADERVPRAVKLRGSWSLNADHDLVFTVQDTARGASGVIILRGEIIKAEGGALVFELGTRDEVGNRSLYLLRLGGSWRADDNNRLVFAVEKERGAPDILGFNCAWDTGRDNRLTYRYEKRDSARGRRGRQTLIFKGAWSLSGARKLAYTLEGSTDAAFEFTASAREFTGTALKYDIGITAASSKAIRRRVVFFGSWRIKKDGALTFEARNPGGPAQVFVFGAQARLTGRETIAFKLSIGKKAPYESEVKLTRAMLKGDGELFLKLLASKAETAVTIGAGVRW